MDLFGLKAKKELREAKNALKECSEKLIEKQEVINKTNAFWKKKLHDLKAKSPKKKNL